MLERLRPIFIIIFTFFLGLTFGISPALANNYYTNQVNTGLYRNIGTPEGIVLLSDNSFWYADSQNYRIVKMDNSGNILRTIGRNGTGEGEFENTVKDITKDSDGNLYVLDYCHISKLDQYGGFQSRWSSCGSDDDQLSNATAIHYSSFHNYLLVADTGHHRIVKFSLSGSYLGSIGSSGSNDGEFNEPWGVTTNSAGNIYVVDGTNHRIQIFNSSGSFISKFGSNNPGDFELYFPKDVVVLSDNSIIVTSQNTQTVKHFDSTGSTLLRQWGSSGSNDNQFTSPQYLDLQQNGTVWVTDWGAKRLQHFQTDGTLINIIKNSGTENGKFVSPLGLDFDSSGNIYVFDSTGRVQKFNSSGTYQSTVVAAGTISEGSMFHLAIDPNTNYIYLSTDFNVYALNTSGEIINTLGNHGVNGSNSASGDFNHARGMAFDSNGFLYVTDLFNNRVQKFDVSHITDPGFDGGYVSEFSVNYPEYITINSNTIYVASPEPQEVAYPQAVSSFDTSGNFLSIFLNAFGVDPSQQYYKISGISFYNGKTYISDPHSDRNHIQVYNSSGEYLETIGSEGSGSEQFTGIRYAKFNPQTNDLVAIDSDNHRIQILTEGVKIRNLIPSADVLETTNNTSLTKKAVDPTSPGVNDLNSNLYFGNYIVSDFSLDLSQDRDWSSVNTISLPNESKALVVNLNPTSAPGVSDTHSLFIVKQPGQDQVRVCPDATAIADVNSSCSHGYTLTAGDPALSTVTINSVEYWKVTGLTGTGAMGSESATPTPTSSPTPTPTPASSSSTSSSSTTSSNGLSACSDPSVTGFPDLFQINATGTSATLYFTPLANTNQYYISYGPTKQAETHGALVTLAREGVQNFTIGRLSPNTVYYFKVRGQLGCQTGEWSNTLSAKSSSASLKTTKIHYRYSPIARLIQRFSLPIKKIIAFSQETPVPPSDQSPVTTPTKTKPTSVPAPTSTKNNSAKVCHRFLWWCL